MTPRVETAMTPASPTVPRVASAIVPATGSTHPPGRRACRAKSRRWRDLAADRDASGGGRHRRPPGSARRRTPVMGQCSVARRDGRERAALERIAGLCHARWRVASTHHTPPDGRFRRPRLPSPDTPRRRRMPDRTSKAETGTIVVSGTGRVAVEPDTADLRLGVSVSRPTVAAARADAGRAMDEILTRRRWGGRRTPRRPDVTVVRPTSLRLPRRAGPDAHRL